MSTKTRKLTAQEIRDALTHREVPLLLSLETLASLLGMSRSTVYEWLAKGRLEGAFRKRGKHTLIWADRALDIVFNGPDWKP